MGQYFFWYLYRRYRLKIWYVSDLGALRARSVLNAINFGVQLKVEEEKMPHMQRYIHKSDQDL